MTVEEWRPIEGWEQLYEVSSHGRVRSHDRITTRRGHPYFQRGRVLKPWLSSTGSALVSLYGNGRVVKRRVGRLVLEAFVGSCPPGMECCHWNDVKTDNRLENLRWDTCSANKFDAVRNGVHTNANKTHCPHGHEYNAANTRINSKGSRYCLECHRARSRERWQKAAS